MPGIQKWLENEIWWILNTKRANDKKPRAEKLTNEQIVLLFNQKFTKHRRLQTSDGNPFAYIMSHYGTQEKYAPEKFEAFDRSVKERETRNKQEAAQRAQNVTRVEEQQRWLAQTQNPQFTGGPMTGAATPQTNNGFGQIHHGTFYNPQPMNTLISSLQAPHASAPMVNPYSAQEISQETFQGTHGLPGTYNTSIYQPDSSAFYPPHTQQYHSSSVLDQRTSIPSFQSSSTIDPNPQSSIVTKKPRGPTPTSRKRSNAKYTGFRENNSVAETATASIQRQRQFAQVIPQSQSRLQFREPATASVQQQFSAPHPQFQEQSRQQIPITVQQQFSPLHPQPQIPLASVAGKPEDYGWRLIRDPSNKTGVPFFAISSDQRIVACHEVPKNIFDCLVDRLISTENASADQPSVNNTADFSTQQASSSSETNENTYPQEQQPTSINVNMSGQGQQVISSQRQAPNTPSQALGGQNQQQVPALPSAPRRASATAQVPGRNYGRHPQIYQHLAQVQHQSSFQLQSNQSHQNINIGNATQRPATTQRTACNAGQYSQPMVDTQNMQQSGTMQQGQTSTMQQGQFGAGQASMQQMGFQPVRHRFGKGDSTGIKQLARGYSAQAPAAIAPNPNRKPSEMAAFHAFNLPPDQPQAPPSSSNTAPAQAVSPQEQLRLQLLSNARSAGAEVRTINLINPVFETLFVVPSSASGWTLSGMTIGHLAAGVVNITNPTFRQGFVFEDSTSSSKKREAIEPPEAEALAKRAARGDTSTVASPSLFVTPATESVPASPVMEQERDELEYLFGGVVADEEAMRAEEPDLAEKRATENAV